jgi:hypothetical protein
MNDNQSEGFQVLNQDHDDPIVADNGPAEINFTKAPLELKPGQQWARAFTTFQELEIRLGGIQKDPQPLLDISQLTFEYAKSGSGTVEATVTYTSTDHETIFIDVAADKLKRKANNKRHVLIPVKPNLRLKTIRGFDPNRVPFTIDLFNANNQPIHNTVSFKVVAVPH